MPEIMTVADIALMQTYIALRDAPRQTMANGVYPNSVKTLGEYETLLLWLADKPDYAALHESTTSQVTAYIAQMQAAMSVIVGIMQGIETAAPGTFGIAMPVDAQPE